MKFQKLVIICISITIILLTGCEKYSFWNLKSLGKIDIPTVTSNNVLNFAIKATILDDGHEENISTGFVWSDVNSKPTMLDNHLACPMGNNSINTVINWSVNTHFYVRAYIENSIGIAYSEPIEVLWPGNASNLPNVLTSNPNQIDFFGLSINGTIISDGGIPITEQGFCFSASNQSPTILNSVVINNSGSSNFSEQLSNLNENTNYYLRAYAKNLQGIAYGNVITITTNNYYYSGEQGAYGGLIFYSKIDTTGGWNFLEAAPNDVIGTYQWANVNTSISTSYALGAGKSNTLTIIQQLGSSNPYYAALAAYYFPSGLNGWCLPSREELIIMRENLYLSQLGNFAIDETYWSSSQDTGFTSNAWTVKMTNGVNQLAAYAKTSLYRIRPIRRY
jgi:hypothetical protein